MAVVTVGSLTREAIAFQDVLRALPLYSFNEVAVSLGLNVQEVVGEDKEISTRRKGGLVRGYFPGLTPNQNFALLGFFEQSLKPEIVYASFKDNINNYREKKVLTNAGEKVDNKTKAHPLEQEILKNAALSINEDVVFNLFFAERGVDAAGSVTPATAFNGFNSKIAALKVAGEIAAGKGNLVNTGAIAAPVDANDTAAYDLVVTFIRAAHPLLRRGETELRIGLTALSLVRDAYKNKVKAFNYPTLEEVIQRLRDDSMCPGLVIRTHEAYGNGGQLMLTKPGLFDIGFNVESDKDYIQVRTPYEDPNDVQFWGQFAVDTRIKDIHEKIFLTNEVINTSNSVLIGDR